MPRGGETSMVSREEAALALRVLSRAGSWGRRASMMKLSTAWILAAAWWPKIWIAVFMVFAMVCVVLVCESEY